MKEKLISLMVSAITFAIIYYWDFICKVWNKAANFWEENSELTIPILIAIVAGLIVYFRKILWEMLSSDSVFPSGDM